MRNILIIVFCLIVNFLDAQNLIPEQNKKGLFGYKKDKTKRWAIKPTFQEAKQFGEMGLDSSLAFVKQNNLWGVIDQKGKWKIEPKYTFMSEDVYFKIVKAYLPTENKVFDILDRKGNIKLEQSNQIDKLNKDFVMVTKNGKENLFKLVNEELITTSLQDCEKISFGNFDEEFIIAFRKGELNGIYQSENQILKGYDKLTILNKKNAIGKKGNEWEKIDVETLNTSKIGVFDNLDVIKEDLFWVRVGNQKGFISLDETILPIEYDEIKSFGRFGSDLALIILKNQKGLFDLKERKIIFPSQFEDVEEYNCEESIYILSKNKLKTLYHIGRKQIIKEQVQELSCLNTKKMNVRKQTVILLKANNKFAILKADKFEWIISDFFDKIEVLNGVHIYGEESIYDELIVYKGNNKSYLNIVDFSLSKKPLLQKYLFKNEEDFVYQEFEVAQNADCEGGINTFRKKLSENVKYPEKAKAKKTQGNVVLQFIINKEGYVDDIKILKDIGDGCGEAAVEALKSVDIRWAPAKNSEGKPVKVRKTIPIAFKL